MFFFFCKKGEKKTKRLEIKEVAIALQLFFFSFFVPQMVIIFTGGDRKERFQE